MKFNGCPLQGLARMRATSSRSVRGRRSGACGAAGAAGVLEGRVSRAPRRGAGEDVDESGADFRLQ